METTVKLTFVTVNRNGMNVYKASDDASRTVLMNAIGSNKYVYKSGDDVCVLSESYWPETIEAIVKDKSVYVPQDETVTARLQESYRINEVAKGFVGSSMDRRFIKEVLQAEANEARLQSYLNEVKSKLSADEVLERAMKLKNERLTAMKTAYYNRDKF